MKESYVEGLADRNGPESCVGAREGVGEALTGVRAGRVFSRERDNPPGCRRRRSRRKATSGTPQSRGVSEPRAVRDPVHVRKHLAREPGGPAFARPRPRGRPHREVFGRTPMMLERGKSDGPIVPGKSSNNGRGRRLDQRRPTPSPAEGMEGRGPAKGNRRGTRTRRTQRRNTRVPQALAPIRWMGYGVCHAIPFHTSSPKAGAGCGKPARPDLCGGRAERPVPTATAA